MHLAWNLRQLLVHAQSILIQGQLHDRHWKLCKSTYHDLCERLSIEQYKCLQYFGLRYNKRLLSWSRFNRLRRHVLWGILRTIHQYLREHNTIETEFSYLCWVELNLLSLHRQWDFTRGCESFRPTYSTNTLTNFFDLVVDFVGLFARLGLDQYSSRVYLQVKQG